MARVYATLNANALGPALEIELGGLVLTSNVASLDIHRLARASIPIASSKGYFEVAFYGEGALLDQAAVGIVKATHGLAKYVGEQSTGFGLKVGNGGIYSNNALVTATAPVDKKTFIGVLVDMAALTCSFFAQGSLIATVSIGSGSWYPAITVSSAVAYDLRAYVNFGQYAFRFPQDGTVSNNGTPIAGWFNDTVTPEALFFCTKEDGGFHSDATDTVPLIGFDPRITNANSFAISRRCSVWPWGETNAGATYSAIEIDNADGAYDFIIGEDRRDQVATFVITARGSDYDSGTTVGTAVVDKIEGGDGDRIRITFKDRIASLKRPLQRKVFPPFADAGVANRPIPITLGACRNVNPPLESQVDRIYRLHDAPITNIAAARDKGAILDPHATPPQYTPTNDLQGLILQTLPVGLFTVDVSSKGAQVVIPGASDVLAGAGAMTAWPVAGSPPTGFAFGAGTGNTLTRKGTANALPQNYVAELTTTKTFNPSATGAPETGAWLRWDTAVLLPGKTYRVQIRLARTSGSPSPPGVNGIGFGFMMRTDLSALAADGAISPHLQPIQAPQFGTTGVSYSFTYTVPAGAARKIYMIACAAVDGTGHGYGVATATFYDLRVELLGEVAQALPLEGISLKDHAIEVLQTRGGVLPADWVPADCDAIDAATGYRFGQHIAETVSIEDAAREPLNSFCATMFTDWLGRYRIRRLVDPETVPDASIVYEFDTDNIVGNVRPFPDYALGLTTTIGARRNWKVFSDSDFVTDELVVPPALKTQYKRSYQFIRTAAGSPQATYQFAANAQPLESLLDDPAQAQAELDRVVGPFCAGRVDPVTKAQILTTPRFVQFVFSYDGNAPPTLLFGDVVRVTFPRHRLSAGQKFAVVDVTIYPYAKRVEVTAWGTK